MIYVHIVLVAGSSKSVKFRATQENVFFSRARTRARIRVKHGHL